MVFKNLKKIRNNKKTLANKQRKKYFKHNKKTIKKGGMDILSNASETYNELLSVITGKEEVDYFFEPIPTPIDFINEMCPNTINNKTKKFYNIN
jgi:hypothetical protein